MTGHERGQRETRPGGTTPPPGHRRDPQHRLAALPAALAEPAGHRGGGGRPLDPSAVPGGRRDQRHWRTLLAIAAVVVVPLTLLQYLLGDWVRTRGEVTSYQQISTATWAVGVAALVAGLAGLLMYLVLTGAITRAVAAEVAGEDPSLAQSYRF